VSGFVHPRFGPGGAAVHGLETAAVAPTSGYFGVSFITASLPVQ
jgi:hypothetical protein